ncbi:MAG TPA: UDP-N-acetylmuramate dehydrogenase [Candidatus Paceibacterota bacterium]|nr:UDP-N-acetylmuramate dehydrogenase [Candidatus Paceibacterota bacterium]
MVYESGKIYEGVTLAQFSTLKVGGKSKYFCVVKSVEELRGALAESAPRIPVFILGGGSNILIPDEGFEGLVIKMGLKGVSYASDEDTVVAKVAAGENWDTFVSDTVSRGLWGIENLSGIPGTVGGAPIQNIGAYGAEVSSVIESVKIFDLKTDKEKILSNKECRFSYRDSIFKKPEGKRLIVLEVTFRLSKTPNHNISYKDLAGFFAEQKTPPTLSEIRSAVLSIRSRKFPDLSLIGTAGSFFKNPIISKKHFEKLQSQFPNIPSFLAGDSVKVPLAFILDKICGLKGYAMGNVGLFENQPLVLINKGGATSNEIKVFSKEIKKAVKNKTGIDIEEEVIQVV